MIVDDLYIVREGIKRLLSLSQDIEVICEAENGYEAIDKLAKHYIDIVLLDIEMPKLGGLETAKKIKEMYPKVKIIILTTFKEDEYIFSSIRLGINGFLLKDSDIDEINTCIRKVYSEKIVFDSAILPMLINAINDKEKPAKPDALSSLTEREFMIARMIVNGMSNSEIAKSLFITEGTVKNTISKILRKLNIQRRTQLNSLMGKDL
jgi:DNA-binding NarL/FixJ family response regulator